MDTSILVEHAASISRCSMSEVRVQLVCTGMLIWKRQSLPPDAKHQFSLWFPPSCGSEWPHSIKAQTQFLMFPYHCSYWANHATAQSLVTSLSSHRPGFHPTTGYVGFVIKWKWDRFFYKHFGYKLSVSFHNDPYSYFIHLWVSLMLHNPGN